MAMNELQLFVDAGADDLERALLLSAKDDHTPDGAAERALSALGIAAPLVAHSVVASAAGASAAAGAASKGAGVATLVVVKWLGIGLLAGAATGGALVVAASHQAASERSVATHVTFTSTHERSAPAHPAPLVPPPPVAVESAVPAAAFAPSAQPTAGAQDVSKELALLDRARKALGAGEAHAALSALAEHDRRFPHGELGLEAKLLRVEALVAGGDNAQATRRARAFLAAHPNSPYTARVKVLLAKATHTAAPPSAAKPHAAPHVAAPAAKPHAVPHVAKSHVAKPHAPKAPAPNLVETPSSNVATFPSQ